MKIFSFLNANHEVIAVVKAKNHKSSLKKVAELNITKTTPYFSEPLEECLYYNF